MPPDSHRVRRLRSQDLSAFRQLQQYSLHAVHSRATKEVHNRWVAKAAREITFGERIGYGLFDTSVEPAPLIACIVLRCTSSNIIELKNLVVRDSGGAQSAQARRKAHTDLILHAERASIHRGFSRLEIQLLSVDHEQLEIFISLGYTIQSLQESTATVGITHYFLWKQVPPEYHGDPFDFLSIARWLLAERLNWSIVDQPKLVQLGVSDQYAFRLQFEIPAQLHLASRTPSLGYLGRIIGDCLVDIGSGQPQEFISLMKAEATAATSLDAFARPAIRLLVSTRELEEVKEAASQLGFRAALGRDLLQLIGYLKADEPFNLGADSVRGLLLHVGAADMYNFRIYCEAGTPFSYVILNGLGDAVYSGLVQDDSREFFAVFCTERDEGMTVHKERELMVVGWAQIQDAVPRPPTLVESELRDRNTLWQLNQGTNGHLAQEQEARVRFFVNPFSVNFQESQIYHILHLDPPTFLLTPRPLSELAENDAGVKPLLAELHQYGLTACYAQNIVPTVRSLPCWNWTRRAAAEVSPQVTIPLEFELLGCLENCLMIILYLPYLQSIIESNSSTKAQKQDLAREINEQLGEIREQRKKIRARQEQRSAAKQGDLFEDLETDSPLKVRLSLILRETRAAIAAFWQKEPAPDSRMARVKVLTSKICSRMLSAVRLGGALRFFSEGSLAPSERWLVAVARQPRPFRVGLTFSGVHRQEIVAPVAGALARKLGKDRVFYDRFHEASLGGFMARELLEDIYLNQCDLIVAFLSDKYGEKWTGIEWERVLDYVREEGPSRVLPIKLSEFDSKKLGLRPEDRDILWNIGLDSGTGYMDAEEVCEGILRRLSSLLPSTPS